MVKIHLADDPVHSSALLSFLHQYTSLFLQTEAVQTAIALTMDKYLILPHVKKKSKLSLLTFRL